MNDNEIDMAVGFVQDIPGGFVAEIGNGWLRRRIHCVQGRIGTTSLENSVNAEEYLDETIAEFAITLMGEGRTVDLDFRDFQVDGCETPEWDDAARTVRIDLSAEINSISLRVSIFYSARAGEDFITKWIHVHPSKLENWVIKNVTLENMRLKEMVEGVSPFSRYPRQYDNYEDDVHGEPDKARTDSRESRFEFGDQARAVVTYWGYNEGLYFFMASLTGEEVYHRPTGLVMKHHDYVPLTQGLTTGKAVVGAYAGPPGIGFKRYTRHLSDHWCAIAGKRMPVAWSTWLVALSDYDRYFLLRNIPLLADAGFYEVLHLDLGWETEWPLRVDASKFPNGISEIARRAHEAGMDMSYWVNPYSCNYWKPTLGKGHPEYTVPGKVSPRSNANALCVLTEYSDYVKKRFVDLVTEMNARAIVWDGSDWNIPLCNASRHHHRNQYELDIKAIKKLAEICQAAHAAREDLIISAFSLPPDNHRLCALDQEQVSDTHEFPTIQSELIQRRQLYQMTWEHPFRAIRGSWYGVGWHEAGAASSHPSTELRMLRRPMAELIHAEMSMIANGLAQSGGGIDLAEAGPEFIGFLKKLFAFRKRFEKFFNTYQHVLGFPDGEHVDGSGHIIDGSGFIVLVNPTRAEQTVRLPLMEPELELPIDRKHALTDWSNLERGIPIGSGKIENAPEIDLGPLEVKYIGVNVG